MKHFFTFMIIFALLIVIPATIALYKKSKDLQFKIRVEEKMNSIKISNRFLEINNSDQNDYSITRNYWNNNPYLAVNG